MKIAALTMVYRDYWALSRWYAHHGRQLGYENLVVVAHGADPKIAEICPQASVITIPRDSLDHFDKKRAEFLDGVHRGLCADYDWVVRTDADELVCFDPELYPTLTAAIAENAKVPVLTALGFDLLETSDDAPLSPAETAFSQRRHIAFSGHYSKAVASRRAIDFALHGVRVAPRRLQEFPFHMPRGLFLAHLKYANSTALADATKVRMQVANTKGDGLPGAGWQAADEDAATFRKTFMAKQELPWNRSEPLAHATLSIKPSRLERFNVVKARALKLKHRTMLPDRFADQG